jgi:acylphosphatase
MSAAIARHVRVYGRVQGVFFRDSTQTEAQARGVAGWVRNDDDGTVEAWFEGDPDAVQALVSWCSSGPSRASVDSVEAAEVEPAGLSGFDVR